MKLANSLTGTLEKFVTIKPGHVGVYVCGVTPYSASHIGHAMSAIVYDVLVRYLRWPGNRAGSLEVTYVSNYTDVDDKIIDRAAELGMDALELSNLNIEQWEREQVALGLLPPDVRPRVSTEIPAIIALIERIIANGHAYATTPGNVYFRVTSKADYGKLSHRTIDQLRTGTRFEPGDDKEFALDFALWKTAKPGEPHWTSPWGEGRPGWHIECSAMSQRYLGDTFDIHGGGVDLVFPHHENEVAQSEAATGKPFANLWMHNGMVLRDGEKMSKSLGNTVTVEEALTRWSPDAIRVFAISSQYRTPNNLTDEALEAAGRAVDRLATALEAKSAAERGAPVVDATEARQHFIDALEDDLNTAQALAALFELARAINRGRDEHLDITAAQHTLYELAWVLGLRLERESVGMAVDALALGEVAARFGLEHAAEVEGATIEALLARREEARAAREFGTSDAIRAALENVGIEIKDTPQGATWSVRA
ncbi:MAG: cysteine--tRNA ligase [Dehalococcoidia bacterium]|nr:cysteine--tRNA ligase [Dehalococcoidia bacterium]